MNRNNAGRFAPKPKTDWIEALTTEELDLLNEQLPTVVRFKDVDPSTADEGADYLSACYLVHWLSCIGMRRQGHPACDCHTCTQVEAAIDENEAEQRRADAAEARAARRLQQKEEQERRADEQERSAPTIEPPALLAEPLDPDERIQVISAHGPVYVRRGDLEEI